jgi:hypothetical protein
MTSEITAVLLSPEYEISKKTYNPYSPYTSLLFSTDIYYKG